MVKILSVLLYDKNIFTMTELISREVESGKTNNNLLSATGAHGLVIAQKDLAFREILNSFKFNLPDGMPAVWIGKLKGAKEMERCFGPDFFRETIISTKDKNINHFFCGGKEGVAEKLKQNCQVNFGNKHIVGIYTPPFREMTDLELAELGEEINRTKTDILWIGLSTPKQEIFAVRISKYINVNFICTVGAAFDYHTQSLHRAPIWMQKSGLEWFFRLMLEPKRLWRRYFEIVPLFIFYNLTEVLIGKFFKNN